MDEGKHSVSSRGWLSQVVILALFGLAGLMLALLAGYLLFTMAAARGLPAEPGMATPSQSRTLLAGTFIPGSRTPPTPMPIMEIPPTATRTATATASPTATATASPTASATPTRTGTFTASATKTRTPTRTRTWTPSNTWTRSPTRTISATRTFTPTSTPTISQTPSDTLTPTPTDTATISDTPTPTASETPTLTATVATTMTPVATLAGHAAPVRGVAINPQTPTPGISVLVTGDNDGILRFWDAISPTPEPATTATATALAAIVEIAFFPDGSGLASAALNGMLEIWDSDDQTRTSSCQFLGTPNAIAVSSSNNLLIVGSTLGLTQTWTTSPCGLQEDYLSGRTEAVTDVAFAPINAWIGSSGQDGIIYLWNEATAALPFESISRVDTDAEVIAFSPDESLFATGWADGWLYVYQTTGSWDVIVYSILAQAGVPVHAIAFSADGSRIAVGGAEGKIQIYDTESVWWKQYELDAIAYGDVLALSFSPDGHYLISGHLNSAALLWYLP